ncbi:MAG: GGDEF domain-containing protein [Gemmatimonadetes bacterium]|nr:GGDEF domain-containing protein [Gemmatimonadota bacterium]
MTRNRAIQFTWPEGAAALVGVAFVAWPTLNAAARPLLRVLPYLALGAGAVIGWRFGRGRLLFALVTIAVADQFLTWLAPPAPPGAAIARAGALLVSLLLPANLAALAFLPETPAFSRIGRWWGAAFAGQVALAALFSRTAPDAVGSVLSLPIFPVEPAWLSMSQFGVVAFVATGILHGYRAWHAPDPTTRGFFWSTVVALIAVNAPSPGTRTLYLAVAGLVLLVSMIEASYSLAFLDELTGLPGRRAFNQALSGLGGEYVIALVDVDHSKQFNDQHGHDVGDQVLRLVAGRLIHVGDGGRGYRYGGEEFAVIFPDSTLEESREDLDALRIAIEASTFTFRGTDRPREDPKGPKRNRPARRRDLSVTVSIGAAEPGSRQATPALVVEAADQALYRAKDTGRNRVVTTP